MNTYVTGTTIKRLREVRNMTQSELAEKIGVSCCGVTLPALEAEEANDDHAIIIENIDKQTALSVQTGRLIFIHYVHPMLRCKNLTGPKP